MYAAIYAYSAIDAKVSCGVGLVASLLAERNLRPHRRASARSAGDMQAAAERVHPIGEPAQPGARARIGAAHAVVGDLDDSPSPRRRTVTTARDAAACLDTFASDSETT